METPGNRGRAASARQLPHRSRRAIAGRDTRGARGGDVRLPAVVELGQGLARDGLGRGFGVEVVVGGVGSVVRGLDVDLVEAGEVVLVDEAVHARITHWAGLELSEIDVGWWILRGRSRSRLRCMRVRGLELRPLVLLEVGCEVKYLC